MKDIKNIDSNKILHGYQEWYRDKELKLRVVMKHGLEIGYEEWYKKYGPSEINFYIK
jgi:hypothetical protein